MPVTKVNPQVGSLSRDTLARLLDILGPEKGGLLAMLAAYPGGAGASKGAKALEEEVAALRAARPSGSLAGAMEAVSRGARKFTPSQVRDVAGELHSVLRRLTSHLPSLRGSAGIPGIIKATEPSLSPADLKQAGLEEILKRLKTAPQKGAGELDNVVEYVKNAIPHRLQAEVSAGQGPTSLGRKTVQVVNQIRQAKRDLGNNATPEEISAYLKRATGKGVSSQRQHALARARSSAAELTPEDISSVESLQGPTSTTSISHLASLTAMEKLPPNQRKLVDLWVRYKGAGDAGRIVDRIAQETKLPPAQVRRELETAQGFLRNELRPEAFPKTPAGANWRTRGQQPTPRQYPSSESTYGPSNLRARLQEIRRGEAPGPVYRINPQTGERTLIPPKEPKTISGGSAGLSKDELMREIRDRMIKLLGGKYAPKEPDPEIARQFRNPYQVNEPNLVGGFHSSVEYGRIPGMPLLSSRRALWMPAPINLKPRRWLINPGRPIMEIKGE